MTISGKKAIFAIIKNPKIRSLIKNIYISQTQKQIISICQQYNVPYQIKEKNFFDIHYNNKTKYKYKYAIAILANKKTLTLQELINKYPKKCILVMLDHLQDPFNVGSILRTCAAAGIQGVIIPKNKQAPINHDATLKASQGYALNIDIVVVTNLCQTISILKKNNFLIYATDINPSAKLFNEISYSKKSVLILGSEGDGVSPILKKISDIQIYIPMTKGIDSLNVSVAAGILIFEIIKKIQ